MFRPKPCGLSWILSLSHTPHQKIYRPYVLNGIQKVTSNTYLHGYHHPGQTLMISHCIYWSLLRGVLTSILGPLQSILNTGPREMRQVELQLTECTSKLHLCVRLDTDHKILNFEPDPTIKWDFWGSWRWKFDFECKRSGNNCGHKSDQGQGKLQNMLINMTNYAWSYAIWLSDFSHKEMEFVCYFSHFLNLDWSCLLKLIEYWVSNIKWFP